MAISWLPPDLSQACSVHTTVTTCSSSTLMFLQLVATLFGQPRDKSHNNLHADFREFIFGGDSFNEFESSSPYESGEDQPHMAYKRSGDVSGEEYDFIVVGAGSAGCVVANRLSEIQDWKILLLEVGGEEPEVSDVPSFPPLLQRSSIDWAYMTQSSPHSCLARPQGQCYWARGKVMGGSSTINYMIYVRGGPKDYDEWAELGNPGWKYEDVLPYFIKSEDNHNIELTKPYFHGQGGYQSVEIYPYQDKNIFHIIDAFRELGLPEIDPNSDDQIGVSLLQTTTRDGRRESTNSAFIRPIVHHRDNLIIKTNAHASRVLIDSHTKKAFGVEYYVKGKVHRAVVKKEVILSAGAINSPQLLMLSGIGPTNNLRSHGIKVIKDLPVGLNLHDHATMDGVVFALTNKSATTVDDHTLNSDIYYYKKTHRGALSAAGPLQVNAMVQTKYEKSKTRPDIQFSFDAANVKNFFSDPILTAETSVNPLAYYDGFMVRPILLNPKSRGYLELNFSDPVFGPPIINANTFSERIDLLKMVEGVKQSLNLLQTKSMKKIQASLVTLPLPACYGYDFGTDDYWACVASSYTTTIFHPVGTCKMGPKKDKSAVVDSKLRVHGIKNLRVIDASIMPKIPRGNTNAPTIMIAEKGTDYIKEQWLESYNWAAEQFPYHIHKHGDDYFNWNY